MDFIFLGTGSNNPNPSRGASSLGKTPSLVFSLRHAFLSQRFV